MTAIPYLEEIRRRLIKITVVFLGVGLVCCLLANTLYHGLALPMLQHLPHDKPLIATQVAGTFLAPFKLALFTAFFICAPFILYQVWAFLAPALYPNERRLIWPLFFVSSALFYAGVIFCYAVVMPLMLGFFVHIAPSHVEVRPDINHYLDFSLKLFFAFGVAFQVPVVTWLLLKTGIATPQTLSKSRPYVVVLAFVLGMLLTPPDVISQILLALPIWVLFELGLLFGRRR